jgi:hypothetical protein
MEHQDLEDVHFLHLRDLEFSKMPFIVFSYCNSSERPGIAAGTFWLRTPNQILTGGSFGDFTGKR